MEELDVLQTRREYFSRLCNSIGDCISTSPSPEIARILADAVFNVAKILIE